MRVLVACEESQTSCLAFRSFGDEAFSCDLQPCSGGHPEWHIQCDVINHLNSVPSFYYDLIIAHPPCTYLSAVSASSLFRGGFLNIQRYEKLLLAREFFMFFYNFEKCHRVCIENPRPLKIANLPPYNQIIQPYDFGANWSKQTCLWLKNLPPLFPSVIEYNRRSAAPSWVLHHSGSVQRSKSFPEISVAMANQWRY